MQRLSIGSPSRAQAIAVAGEVAPMIPEAEEAKPDKPARSCYMKERSVHLIPVLTLLCLLVLYLSSHDLSTTDVSSFDDSSHFIHGTSMSQIGRYEGVVAAGVIVKHRGLKADAKLQSRKLGSDKEQRSGEGASTINNRGEDKEKGDIN